MSFQVSEVELARIFIGNGCKVVEFGEDLVKLNLGKFGQNWFNEFMGKHWWLLGPSGLGFESSVPPIAVTIPLEFRDPAYPNRQPKPPNLPLAYKQV